jgi:hypothetical protein
MSFLIPPSQASVSPLALPDTNLNTTSPPLLVLAAFSGVAVLGSAALACFVWTRSRARRMARASTYVANEYSRDMREVEREKAGLFKEKPEMWDLWTAQDEERCITGKNSWENVMVCLSVTMQLHELKATSHGTSLCLLYEHTTQGRMQRKIMMLNESYRKRSKRKTTSQIPRDARSRWRLPCHHLGTIVFWKEIMEKGWSIA